MNNLHIEIQDQFKKSAEVKLRTAETQWQNIEKAINLIVKSIEEGGKVLVCGNGGSAADSQHIAAEFIGRFLINRKALPAIALTTDTSILTAVANDFSYDQVFTRQVEALGKTGDV
ncbi:SIS domain-containing protein, partial [bacterium]|nr:SIS domain-containing protein [bacterium]